MLLEKVRVVLNGIKEEGLENVFKRHNRLARATRAAVKAMGLAMVAPNCPAGSTIGVFVPESIDGAKLVKSLRDDFGVTLEGGQDQWKGRSRRSGNIIRSVLNEIAGYIRQLNLELTNESSCF